MKKSLFAASAVATLGLGSLAGLHVTQAATATEGTSIIDRIATRFNLNKTDVQQVFDQDRQEKMAKHEAGAKTRLDQAVKDGKLTQAQEDQIISKQKELKDSFESVKDKSASEKQTALKTKMDETIQWAKDNSIPQEYMLFGHGGMRGHHGMPKGHLGMRPFAPADAK